LPSRSRYGEARPGKREDGNFENKKRLPVLPANLKINPKKKLLLLGYSKAIEF
jgi:hypothetical protein